MHDGLKSRRQIPAVGKLLEQVQASDLPRALVVKIIREQVTLERSSSGDAKPLLDRINDQIEQLRRRRLQPVINGTGIIIHTNFGRAPLGVSAARAIAELATSYNNLEFDLASGGRGQRGAFLEGSLALLSGSEAATVVNNCAAALVLIVRHFTQKKPEVIISRGELVQIGGGFRIGEIIAASGARVREVGATNRTDLQDYGAATGSNTGLILRVHQSNFYLSGFTASPPNDEIAKLAHARRVPFAVDLGSGALVATEKFGLSEHEPTPAETLRRGADLVCFSGDKLFGGPQAGIVAGRARLIAALKREPLFRAVRCDKFIFAAIEATADAHLRQDWEEIPVLALLRTSLESLRARGEALVRQIDSPLRLRLVKSEAEIGGGALPRSRIASIALEITGDGLSPNELAKRLRATKPAIIGRIARGKFQIDLRTVFPWQDETLAHALTGVVIPSETRDLAGVPEISHTNERS